MRIHFLLVIFSVIATILLTWHLSTQARIAAMMVPKNTPLPPEDLGLSPLWDPVAENHELTANPTQTNLPIPTPTTQTPPNPNLEPEPEPEIDLESLKAAPSLSEYRTLAQESSPQTLLDLSTKLRTLGHFQRALLALERVIDSSQANAEQLEIAAQGLAALSPTLPPWAVDPAEELPLILNLGVAQVSDDSLDSAAQEVAQIIRQSSGEILQIETKIHTPKNPPDPETESPIALWISPPGDDPPSTAVITFKLSGDSDSLTEQISLATFSAVRSHLARFDFPLPPALDPKGQHLLSSHLTRLMWHRLATSLESPPESPPE